MKAILIHLDDLEHEVMKAKKTHRSWKEALIEGCNSINNQNNR